MLTSHPEGHTVELLLYRYEIQHLRVTGFQNGAGRNKLQYSYHLIINAGSGVKEDARRIHYLTPQPQCHHHY